MGAVANLIFIIVLVIIVLIFWPKISALIQLGTSVISNPQAKYNFTFPSNTANQTGQALAYRPSINYTLMLINKDRAANGLPNVTLSPIPSAQQHADSMLQYNYFSHWDVYGMKPYMRYTLLSGRGAMQENIAYKKSGLRACIGTFCKSYGAMNVTAALANLEYTLVYNDSACCNNGHRDNILDPDHNQVSIGIAYNSTNVYLVEDFVDSYITWLNNTPSFSSNNIYLKGITSQNQKLSTIEIAYDQPTANMTQQQLNRTSEYGYGDSVAGVVGSSLDYYPGLITIVADSYYNSGNDFAVRFSMAKLIGTYGAGEYTVALWVNNTVTHSSFIGATYTVFINSSDAAFTPKNV